MTWFRYARHAEACELLATGLWELAALDLGHHSHWSVLLRWIGQGEPPSRINPQEEPA